MKEWVKQLSSESNIINDNNFNIFGSNSPRLAASEIDFMNIDTPSACGGVVHFYLNENSPPQADGVSSGKGLF